MAEVPDPEGGEIHAVFFDLDSTLIHGEPSKPYPETVKTLEHVHKKKKKIFLVSFSGIGIPCLVEAKIAKFFTEIRSAYSPTQSKRGYIQDLLNKYGIKRENALFADDLMDNINDIRDFGIRSIHVDEEKGILLQQLIAAGV